MVHIFEHENVREALTLCEGDAALRGDWGGRLSPVDGGHGDDQEVGFLYFFSSPLLSSPFFFLSFVSGSLLASIRPILTRCLFEKKKSISCSHLFVAVKCH